MTSDFSIISFVTSPSYLIIFFLILTALLHFIIIYVKNPNDIFWKKVDYLWLSLTIFGLFSSSGIIERHISKTLLYSQEIPRLQTSYQNLYDFFETRASSQSWYCQDYKYDDSFLIEKEKFEKNATVLKKQCLKFQQQLKKLPIQISEPYPSLQELNLPNNLLDNLEPNEIILYQNIQPDEAHNYQDSLDYYNEQYLIYANTKEKMEISDLEFLLIFVSPLFICFGLAIRVTKVTGDILNAKKKIKSS